MNPKRLINFQKLQKYPRTYHKLQNRFIRTSKNSLKSPYFTKDFNNNKLQKNLGKSKRKLRKPNNHKKI